MLLRSSAGDHPNGQSIQRAVARVLHITHLATRRAGEAVKQPMRVAVAVAVAAGDGLQLGECAGVGWR